VLDAFDTEKLQRSDELVDRLVRRWRVRDHLGKQRS
jgi:hypothetical protein